MSDRLPPSYVAHWKLRQAKQVIFLICLIGFLAFNWGETFQTLKFLWTCLFTDAHDIPISNSYWRTDFVTYRVGTVMARFSFCMLAAYIVGLAFEAFRAPVDLTERELLNRRKRLLQNHWTLTNELDAIEKSSELIRETTEIRKSLISLHEDLARIRLEADAINTVKTRRKKPADTLSKVDLFSAAPVAELPHCKPKRRKALRKSSKPPAPEL